MVDEMANLQGKFVLGASWELPAHYGRGETRKQLLAKKNDPTTSATSFAMNYESKWTGATDSSLVNINKLLSLRTLKEVELSCPKDSRGNFELNEYVIAVDVARSDANSNNKSAIGILKIIRNSNSKIRQVQLVNIVEPPNGLTFKEQSIILKILFYKYGGSLDIIKSRVKAVVIDGNGLGKGLVDYMAEDVTDPETNKELGAFNLINTDNYSKKSGEVIYSMNASGINKHIITNFMDMVDSATLKLLSISDDIKKDSLRADLNKVDANLARILTQGLVDEVSNLKVKRTSNNMTVEQVLKKIDKDKYSAVAYGLYYIKLFLDYEEVVETYDATKQYVIF